ncbi:hypothetical protein V2J09_015365 [Rumex salicifolius]
MTIDDTAGDGLAKANMLSGISFGFSVNGITHHWGYKVMNIRTSRVFLSRDVVFHESVFPMGGSSTSNSSLPLPMPSISSESDDLPAVDSSPEIVPDTSTSLPLPVSPPVSNPQPEVPLRRSSRPTQLPSYLHDFVCNGAFTSDQFPFVGGT